MPSQQASSVVVMDDFPSAYALADSQPSYVPPYLQANLVPWFLSGSAIAGDAFAGDEDSDGDVRSVLEIPQDASPTLEELNDDKLFWERPTKIATSVVKGGYRWFIGYSENSYVGMRTYDAEMLENIFNIPEDQRRSLGYEPSRTQFLTKAAPYAHFSNALDIVSYGTGAAYDARQLYNIYVEDEPADLLYQGYLWGDFVSTGSYTSGKSLESAGLYLVPRVATIIPVRIFAGTASLNLVSCMGSIFGDSSYLIREFMKPEKERNTGQMQRSFVNLGYSGPQLLKQIEVLKLGLAQLNSGNLKAARQILLGFLPNDPVLNRYLDRIAVLAYITSLVSVFTNLSALATAFKGGHVMEAGYHVWGLASSVFTFFGTLFNFKPGLLPQSMACMASAQICLMMQADYKENGGSIVTLDAYFRIRDHADIHVLPALNAQRALVGMAPLDMDGLLDLYRVCGVEKGVQQPILEDQPIYRAIDEGGRALWAWGKTPEERRTPEFRQAYLSYVGSVLRAPEKTGDGYIDQAWDYLAAVSSPSKFFPSDQAKAAFLLIAEPILSDENFPDDQIGEWGWVKDEARRILRTQDALTLRKHLLNNDASQKGLLLAYIDMHHVENRAQLVATIEGMGDDFSFLGLGAMGEKMIADSQAYIENLPQEEIVDSPELVAAFDAEWSTPEAKADIDELLRKLDTIPPV